MAFAERPVEIADHRGTDGHLRLSWHPDRRLVNVSQWRNGVCVATTPLDVAEVPALIHFLVSTLEDAATRPVGGQEAPAGPDTPTLTGLGRQAGTVVRRRLGAYRRWLRHPGSGPLAQVIDLTTRARR